MARRLGDRVALGYALNARMHALWGIGPAPERLATGTELGEIADDTGDELLALHGHMWRIRELLAQGDVDAVNEEIARFRARDTGPVHPIEASYAFNVAAMMALLAGDFEAAEQLGQRALHVAEGHNELALSFYGALMMWTWWQRGDFATPAGIFEEVLAQVPDGHPTVSAVLALVHAEAGDGEAARRDLQALAALGWENVADDQAEGVSLAMAAAACSVLGAPAREFADHLYEAMRPYAGTAVVVRAPAAACLGPADHYLGLLAETMGDLALAEVHHDAALRLARRMGSPPFVAAAEMELARTLRRRRPAADKTRVAELLRNAEEAARAMGLHRLARRADVPD
jgi:tetratricopeptide (TPR) repeat protein